MSNNSTDACELGAAAALMMADAPLAEMLSQVEAPDAFAELLLQNTSARGVTLNAGVVRAAIQPDPLGLSRWIAPPTRGSRWPPPPWLPVNVAAVADDLYVDWAYFGRRRLTQSFFEDSVRRALRLPFNALFRYRMTFRDFVAQAETATSLAPTGFIFHMSRCGSTLVAQMLAALPANIVISEAPPIDMIVQLGRACPPMKAPMHARALAAMIAAYGRKRNGDERHFFVKLDSWHTLTMPLFRRAFPSTPWAFLYRDPVEVMVSQMRQRGMQMVREIVHPSLYGLTGTDAMPAEDYCARVLARICGAALAHHRDSGLMVNYRTLPEAVMTTILPHYAVIPQADERAAMREAARQNAKAPSFEFTADSDAKQREASAAIRAASERHLGEIYRAIEAACGTSAA